MWSNENHSYLFEQTFLRFIFTVIQQKTNTHDTICLAFKKILELCLIAAFRLCLIAVLHLNNNSNKKNAFQLKI